VYGESQGSQSTASLESSRHSKLRLAAGECSSSPENEKVADVELVGSAGSASMLVSGGVRSTYHV
jgi:hypothetical protein